MGPLVAEKGLKCLRSAARLRPWWESSTSKVTEEAFCNIKVCYRLLLMVQHIPVSKMCSSLYLCDEFKDEFSQIHP